MSQLNSLPELELAEIVRELGPFPGVSDVAGVAFDGHSIWFAAGSQLVAVSPTTGAPERSIPVPCHAGTAFDGRYLYQLADGTVQKIEPETGRVVSRIAVACENLSGMAWAEGYLWIGQYRAGRIHQVDPASGEIVRTLESDRFVTGVCWLDGELWHGSQSAVEGEAAELRALDPRDGRVLQRLALGAGTGVSGLDSDGRDHFFAGGGSSGKLRVVRRSRRRQRSG